MRSRDRLSEETESRTVHSPEQYNQLRETIRTQDRAQDRMELAKNEIRRLCDCLDVGDVIEDEAIQVYQQIIRTDLINNYSVTELTAAAVYTACREQRVPRTLSDVNRAASVLVDSSLEGVVKRDRSVGTRSTYEGCALLGLCRQTTIQRVYSKICDRLGRTYAPVDPEKFVRRYCEELDFGPYVEEFANVAINQVDDEKFAGRDPNSIAAGAIYYAAERLEFGLTQYELDNVTHRSPSTISETRTLIKESIEP